MTANCWEETELKCDRYCWTSLLEPMLLKSWTTVDLVEGCSEGEEYDRRLERCWAASGVYEILAVRRARKERGRVEEVVARVTARVAAAVAAPIADIVPLTHAAAERQPGKEAVVVVVYEA